MGKWSEVDSRKKRVNPPIGAIKDRWIGGFDGKSKVSKSNTASSIKLVDWEHDMTDQNLFTAYTLGSLTPSNRIVLAPLTRKRASVPNLVNDALEFTCICLASVERVSAVPSANDIQSIYSLCLMTRSDELHSLQN